MCAPVTEEEDAVRDALKGTDATVYAGDSKLTGEVKR